MFEDRPGTLLIAKTLAEHDRIVVYAKVQNWLLIGLVGNITTYLTPSGQVVQIQIKEETDNAGR